MMDTSSRQKVQTLIITMKIMSIIGILVRKLTAVQLGHPILADVNVQFLNIIKDTTMKMTINPITHTKVDIEQVAYKRFLCLIVGIFYLLVINNNNYYY